MLDESPDKMRDGDGAAVRRSSSARLAVPITALLRRPPETTTAVAKVKRSSIPLLDWRGRLPSAGGSSNPSAMAERSVVASPAPDPELDRQWLIHFEAASENVGGFALGLTPGYDGDRECCHLWTATGGEELALGALMDKRPLFLEIAEGQELYVGLRAARIRAAAPLRSGKGGEWCSLRVMGPQGLWTVATYTWWTELPPEWEGLNPSVTHLRELAARYPWPRTRDRDESNPRGK